jgi:aminoglycoside 2'-N-acetyltransferase I
MAEGSTTEHAPTSPDATQRSLEIGTRRTKELDETGRAEVVRLCVDSHHEPDFENLFSYLPPEGLHVLARSGSELVGHAVVTNRWLQPEGLPLLRTAYVDAVSTAPTAQGRGVGSAVMRYLAVAVGDEFDIACLETERVTFYERLGWEEWRGPLAGRSEEGLMPTPEQRGIMILRLPGTPKLVLDGLLTIESHPARIW